MFAIVHEMVRLQRSHRKMRMRSYPASVGAQVLCRLSRSKRIKLYKRATGIRRTAYGAKSLLGLVTLVSLLLFSQLPPEILCTYLALPASSRSAAQSFGHTCGFLSHLTARLHMLVAGIHGMQCAPLARTVTA